MYKFSPHIISHSQNSPQNGQGLIEKKSKAETGLLSSLPKFAQSS